MVTLYYTLLLLTLTSTQAVGTYMTSKSDDVIIPSTNDVTETQTGPDEDSRIPFHRDIRSPKRFLPRTRKVIKTPKVPLVKNTSIFKKATSQINFFRKRFGNSAKKVKIQNRLSHLFRAAKAGSNTARLSLRSLVPTLLGFGTAGAGLATAISQLLTVTRGQPAQELPSVSPLQPDEIQSLLQGLGAPTSGSGATVRKNAVFVTILSAFLCTVVYHD
ncbi:uncharacterized protein [Haliotis cracherodii]|uniref:uncharacterized protein n=1 Tax=Haliotis cracherodii TaxID=6455 RepID=UPI0039EC495C